MTNSKSSPSTDSRIATDPERMTVMARTIRKARVDPCAFARYLLMDPAGVPDPLPEIHRGLQNHLSAHRLALVELPRDHGKTTQVCLRAFETKTPGRRNSDPARGSARSMAA